MVRTELPTSASQSKKLIDVEFIQKKVEDYELENCQRRFSGRIKRGDIMNMLELLRDTGTTTESF